MGRPTKLTPRVQEIVTKALEAGAFFSVACELAGIGDSTGYRWIEEGDKGRSPYREFRDAVKKAEAASEFDALATIRGAARDGTWQAAAWYLERKHPDRWGKRVPMPVPDATHGEDPLAELTRAIRESREAASQPEGLAGILVNGIEQPRPAHTWQ